MPDSVRRSRPGGWVGFLQGAHTEHIRYHARTMGTIGVNVAVFRDGRILLTKREDYHVWCMPGGHIDPGETFPRAARREVREETGLEVAVTRLVGIYSRPRWGDYHIVVFAGEVIGGVERRQPEEVVEIELFGPDELPDALLIGQQQRIHDAFSGTQGVCRVEEYALPFGRPMERRELYRLRDASGLSRQAFYRRYFSAVEGEGSVLEVGSDGTL